MQDERYAGGEEGFAGDLFGGRGADVIPVRRRRRAGRRRREARPLHGGEVAAGLLEQLAAELAHLAAASARSLPGCAAEGRAGSLELLQPRDDAVPQLAEPLLNLLAEVLHAPVLSPAQGLSERLLLAGDG